MPPPLFTHRREAECLAIALAINPGLAANPILLPSLAKYVDHQQSSCLLFLSLLSSLGISTHLTLLLNPPRLLPANTLLFFTFIHPTGEIFRVHSWHECTSCDPAWPCQLTSSQLQEGLS